MELAIIGGLVLAGGVGLHYHTIGKQTNFHDSLKAIFTVLSEVKQNEFAFLAGVITVPYAYITIDGYNTTLGGWYLVDGIAGAYAQSLIAYFIAGLCIGVGVTLGEGGVIHHVVTGTARLSRKQIIQGLLILASAIGFTTLRNYVNIFSSGSSYDPNSLLSEIAYWGSLVLLILFIIACVYFLITGDAKKDLIITYVVGAVIGLGMLYGGLLSQSRNWAFLGFRYWYDYDLIVLFTLLIAGGGGFLAYYLSINVLSGPMSGSYENKEEGGISIKEAVGNIIYGIGWSIGGFAMGPGFAAALIYPPLWLWLGGMVLGVWILTTFHSQLRLDDLDKPLIPA